jgi:divalent metal cation (Fe/Co/Zn/Cd) transporter
LTSPICGPAVVTDASWRGAATAARRLAWVSLFWMTIEGTVGLAAGLRAGSVSLVGWALGSGVEALAAAVIVWRFSGQRSHPAAAERRAQKLVAVSFWLLAPYIALSALRHLAQHDQPDATVVGLVLTGVAVVGMPILGRAKRQLGVRLGSAATVGEARQNYLCALQAAAVLACLAATALSPSIWWLDPAVALALAAWAFKEGCTAWRGDVCC